MLWGIWWHDVVPWIYFGIWPLLFVPVVRWMTNNTPACGRIDNSDDWFGVALGTLVALGLWPVWFIGIGPIYGYAKLVKYVANYERKKVERSS